MARTYAKCTHCENRFPVATMHYYAKADRGGKPAYLCDVCVNLEYSYHDDCATTKEKGAEKSEPWTAGFELETSNHTDRGQAELISYGFKPSSDCSLGWTGREYESPKWLGFGGPTHFTPRIEEMLNNGDISINEDCGCHLHIGYGDVLSETYRRICFEHREQICWASESVMTDNPEKTVQFFGRDFQHYARRSGCVSNRWYDHDARYAWMNFKSSHDTIEFRLNYFQSKVQYNRLIMAEKKIVAALLKHFPPMLIQVASEAERDAMAIKAGKYIARIISKAFDAMDV